MKIVHNVNPNWIRPASPLHSDATSDERYDAEIEASRSKAEKAWKRAQAALGRAERKLTRKSSKSAREAVEELRAEVERRWLELRDLEIQMQSGHVGGANHSGKGSVRNPLPKGSKL